MRSKLMTRLEQVYSKAPHRDVGLSYADQILSGDHESISSLAIQSVVDAAAILGLGTKFIVSSSAFSDTAVLNGQDRLFAIGRKLRCQRYYNLPGGRALYEHDSFKNNGLYLFFLDPGTGAYNKNELTSSTNASILHHLMVRSVEEISIMIDDFDLTAG